MKGPAQRPVGSDLTAHRSPAAQASQQHLISAEPCPSQGLCMCSSSSQRHLRSPSLTSFRAVPNCPLPSRLPFPDPSSFTLPPPTPDSLILLDSFQSLLSSYTTHGCFILPYLLSAINTSPTSFQYSQIRSVPGTSLMLNNICWMGGWIDEWMEQQGEGGSGRLNMSKGLMVR